jgi:hypothetical protein
MGAGAYYVYPALDKEGKHRAVKSIQADYLQTTGVLPPGQNNWLGRLLRAYDTPSDYTLHYFNREYADKHTSLPTHYLAIQRPELGIELTNLHFPGTRLASMGKLEDSFTHPTYRAKPWDDLYSFRCGPDTFQCGGAPTYLNAELIENVNGDLVLSFDDDDFQILANGLLEDISSLGDHVLGSNVGFTDSDVIHAVYLLQYDGHPAIQLEHVGPCDATGGAEGTSLGGGVLSIDDPLFLSAGPCDDGSYQDFCGGYAYNASYQLLGDLDLDRGGLYADYLDAAGVPYDTNPTDTQILFLLISGIRDGSDAYRVDCGCSSIDCSGTGTHPSGPIVLECNADLFIDQEGDRDFHSDHTEIVPRMVLEESIGVHNNLLDGEIPSLFELIREDTLSFCLKTNIDWWWDSAGGFDRYSVLYASFGADPDGVSKNIGLLFANVNVDQFGTILTSFLRFKASDTASNTTANVTITAYDADNPTAPNTNTEASSRTRISTTVDWPNVPVWYAGIWYHSIDISSLIQKIVDRDGWSTGNSIVINVEDNGSDASAERFSYLKGSGFAPELCIGYRRPF